MMTMQIKNKILSSKQLVIGLVAILIIGLAGAGIFVASVVIDNGNESRGNDELVNCDEPDNQNVPECTNDDRQDIRDDSQDDPLMPVEPEPSSPPPTPPAEPEVKHPPADMDQAADTPSLSGPDTREPEPSSPPPTPPAEPEVKHPPADMDQAADTPSLSGPDTREPEVKHPTAEEFMATLGVSPFKKGAPEMTRDDVIALYKPYLTERGNKVLDRLHFFEDPGLEERIEREIPCTRCFDGDPYALYDSPQPRPDDWPAHFEWPINGRHRRAEDELRTVMHEVSHGFDYDNGDPGSTFSWLNSDDVEGVGLLRQALREIHANPPASRQWTGFRHPTKPGVCMWTDYEKIFSDRGRLGYGEYVVGNNIYHVDPELGYEISFLPILEFAANLPLYVWGLPPELEEHYSLFFKDRHKVVQITWALTVHNYDDNYTTTGAYAEGSCP